MEKERSSSLIDAFLLHRKPYSNTSLLIEFFTSDNGRFPAIAKGVQGRVKSPRVGLLQPFTPLKIEWRGRGEVKNLSRVEPGGVRLSLVGDRLFCGLYLNELLMRLLQRNDPHERLFARYEHTLQAICRGAEIENTLRYFELGLLSDLGYGVDLTCEHETGKAIDCAKIYYYHVGGGLSVERRAGGIPLHGRTISLITSDESLDSEALREAKVLTRQLLAFYMDDRPLKSRELFKTF